MYLPSKELYIVPNRNASKCGRMLRFGFGLRFTHKHLLRERVGRAVCQRWGGREMGDLAATQKPVLEVVYCPEQERHEVRENAACSGLLAPSQSTGEPRS